MKTKFENCTVSIPKGFLGKLRRPKTDCLKFKTECKALYTIILLLSGDVELNPGPTTKSVYPCGICETEVTWQCKGICCDNCNIWFHHSCANLDSLEYLLLGRSNTQWKCPRCDSINVDSFTYNSLEISCHNSFSPLAQDGYRSSIDSITSDPFTPTHTSSPQPPNQNKNQPKYKLTRKGNQHSSEQSKSANQDHSSIFDLPPKSNLRILNVNCQSIQSKRSELHTMLQYIKPDLVFGTESWLSNSIASSEIFPAEYNVFRHDRNQIGGGVFILAHKSLTVEDQPDLSTNCEIKWLRVKLQNRKDMHAGVFYMPHRNLKDISELEKSLAKLTSDGAKERDIILAGDFNCPHVDWEQNILKPNASDPEVQRTLINITSNALLTQIHEEPTRMSNILDITFVSNPSLLKSSKSIPGISDHHMVVADFVTVPQRTKPLKRSVFKFQKADWDKIKTDMDLARSEIENMYATNATVNELWEFFKSKLKRSIETHIPTSSLCKKGKLPWINKRILKLIKEKRKAYNKAKTTNIWEPYKKIQKLCRNEIRKAEWNFINNTITHGLERNNNKPFWNYVKSRKKDSTGVSPLKSNGKLHSESKSKANILLNQFKSVFTKPDNTSMPPLEKPTKNIDQIKICKYGIIKLLKDIKPHKAPGPDAIPNLVLETCAENIGPSLTLIFQKSLDSGVLPLDWLTANVSCAYKKGDRNLAENYRPISLTSVPCKILEHVICRYLLQYLEKNGILSNLNHGFRAGYSCDTQLLTTVHDLLKSYENNNQVDIAILDFSKAFHTAPHKKLLHKLHHFGITGPLHDWLNCFLTQRTMKVVVDGVTSETTTVVSGVPQGTVLGPILFLCHINDLPDSVVSQVRLFADDCLLYREIKTFQDHQILQNDLKQLEAWASAWGMRFNAKKCYILSVKQTSSYMYSLDNTILKSVPNNPYLGVLLSSDLQWSDHINKITKKANSTLGFLRRNLRRCPPQCRLNAYLSLVRSTLEYGAIVWNPYKKQDIDAIERIQRAAARFITGDYKSRTPGSIHQLLSKLKLTSLEDRRQQLSLTFFYKVVEGLIPAIPEEKFLTPQRPGRMIRPRNRENYIQKNLVQNYARNNDRCYVIPVAKSEQYRNSFFIKTTIAWNQLENTTVHSSSVDIFRTKISKEHQ